jgi:hypothetical protein
MLGLVRVAAGGEPCVDARGSAPRSVRAPTTASAQCQMRIDKVEEGTELSGCRA